MTKKRTRAPARKPDREVKLIKYERACKAIAAAKRVDEVKRIRDVAVAMKAYARQANNHELEADATEIRMRATRRMDQMRQEQAKTVGLAKGGGGKHGRKRVAEKPTLKDAGINKYLAHEGRKLGRMSDEQFEQAVAEARTLSVAEFKRQTRGAERGRGVVPVTDDKSPTAPRRGPTLTITGKPDEPKKEGGPLITSEVIHRAAAEDFPRQLAEVARYIRTRPESELIAGVLSPDKRTELIKVASDIIDSLNDLKRALWEVGRPKLVGGGDDDGDGGPGAT